MGIDSSDGGDKGGGRGRLCFALLCRQRNQIKSNQIESNRTKPNHFTKACTDKREGGKEEGRERGEKRS